MSKIVRCVTDSTIALMAADHIDESGKLDSGLSQRILRVDEICRKAGGSLYSRQVIAAIIEQWERDNAK